MDTGRGLKRTALVLALFWIVGWSTYAYLGNQEIEIALEELARLDREHPTNFSDPVYRTQMLPWMEFMNEGNRKVTQAVQIGLFAPLMLLILSPFAWFIFRGFKPKVPSKTE